MAQPASSQAKGFGLLARAHSRLQVLFDEPVHYDSIPVIAPCIPEHSILTSPPAAQSTAVDAHHLEHSPEPPASTRRERQRTADMQADSYTFKPYNAVAIFLHGRLSNAHTVDEF